LQLVFIFVGMIIMHRVVTYIPPYSGVPYPEFNVISVVMVFMMIVLSLQTKLGEKVNILVDRLMHVWSPEGTDPKKAKKKETSETPMMALPNPAMSMQDAAAGTAVNQALEEITPMPFSSAIKW
jgi:hypothetical protein